ncbi:DNA cytosine methyltransferase [Dermabacteraceae bacterium P13095]
MNLQRPISIDLFAGAGGLTEGLREAGFASLYANEIVPQYAKTFQVNHTGVVVDTADIRNISAVEVRKNLGLDKGDLDLLAGGPPCQGFSINAPTRSKTDDRNHLFLEFIRFATEFLPKAILIENVPGMISLANGETVSAILTALDRIGYGADVRVLYAPHFGVPQTRWRTIIIGLLGTDIPSDVFPTPTRIAPRRINFTSTWRGRILTQPEPVNLPSNTTLAEAISDLPPLPSGQTYPDGASYTSTPKSEYQERLRTGSVGIYNHRAPKLSNINLERLQHIPPGGNWTNIPHELLPQGMTKARRSDHTKRYGRPAPDSLASTVLTKCDPHWGAFFHYAQDRSFTVREAARIQSFPDTYIFTGNLSEQFAQVGNAVPPMMAEAIGRSLLKSLGANGGR